MVEYRALRVYSCQMTSLGLRPWQQPPCWVDPEQIDVILAAGEKDDIYGTYAAALLLRRLLATRCSRFEPDPLTALRARGM